MNNSKCSNNRGYRIYFIKMMRILKRILRFRLIEDNKTEGNVRFGLKSKIALRIKYALCISMLFLNIYDCYKICYMARKF